MQKNSVPPTEKPEERNVLSSATTAQGYVRKMVAKESNGWGDQSNAQSRLEDKIGLSYWQLEHIRTGRAKTVDGDVFRRIRAAYIAFCEKQVKALQHEIAIEKAVTNDDDLANLEGEMAALAARIKEAKARAR